MSALGDLDSPSEGQARGAGRRGICQVGFRYHFSGLFSPPEKGVAFCDPLYANISETLPPSEFSVEGGEEMSDEYPA